MKDSANQYLEFIRYCIDANSFSFDTEKLNWEGLYGFASQQALKAISFDGIERLKNNAVGITRNLLLRWLAESEQIKLRNQLLNRRCIELVNQLENDGFECCLLKGQGNAAMYTHPYVRTPGDIDVWVKPSQEFGVKDNSFIRETISYAKSHNPRGIANIIHVDYGEWGGVEVELHFWPTYMNSPIYNRRLHYWVRQQEEDVFNNKKKLPEAEGEINIPTEEFNRVYQLSHMFKHVFAEGIGLRQLIDYYYLLKSNLISNKDDNINTLKHLGLYKFAGAVMYIMKEVLGLEDKYLIVQMDERRGKFLLKEILRGGNFGKFDTDGYFVKWNNPVGSFLRHVERDIRLVRYFPSESLWEPLSRIYQHFWRIMYNRETNCKKIWH